MKHVFVDYKSIHTLIISKLTQLHFTIHRCAVFLLRALKAVSVSYMNPYRQVQRTEVMIILLVPNQYTTTILTSTSIMFMMTCFGA